MSLGIIGRLPYRIIEDSRIIALAKNWKEILTAKISRKPLNKIELRNGVVLNAPDEVDLIFLFHEIWLEQIYSPKGYEIKQNDTVVDIGGNIGVFALFAATKKRNVVVHAFEPFPMNGKFFKQNLSDSKLKNVTLHDMAVADKSVERVLQISNSWITHSLLDQESNKNGIIVKCISLDDALSEISSCDLLKLDCEGSEYEILYSSSPNTLKKVKKIVAEFHNIDNKTKNGESLREFLEKNNYKIDIFYSLSNDCGIICANREL